MSDSDVDDARTTVVPSLVRAALGRSVAVGAAHVLSASATGLVVDVTPSHSSRLEARSPRLVVELTRLSAAGLGRGLGGTAESDAARTAFWDDMTRPGSWRVYRGAVPRTDGDATRALVHQLLWCLEFDVRSTRHDADTARLLDVLTTRPVGDHEGFVPLEHA